jgi:hypothetical protein
MENNGHSQILLYPDEGELRVRTFDEVLRDLHKYPPELSAGLEKTGGHTLEDVLREINGQVKKPVFVYEQVSLGYEDGLLRYHVVKFDSLELYDVVKHLHSVGYKAKPAGLHPQGIVTATFRRKPGAEFSVKEAFGLELVEPVDGVLMDVPTFAKNIVKDPDALNDFSEEFLLSVIDHNKFPEYVVITPDGKLDYGPLGRGIVLGRE